MLYGAQRRRKGAGNALVRACDEMLSYKKIFHYRNNSGALPAPTGTFIRFGAPGSPDLIAVIRGLYVGFECKDGPHAKQTPLQKQFQESLEAAGGRYYIIRRPEDLDAALAELLKKV